MLGIAIATLLAVKGMKRKSLSKMGAMAAFIVGYFSIACGKHYPFIDVKCDLIILDSGFSLFLSNFISHVL